MATEESTDVLEPAQVDEEAIARKLNGKVLNVVLVGSAGAGKSTLANTLLGRNVFEVVHSARAITSETAKEKIEVDLKGKGKATMVIHDTPGITGKKVSDKKVKEEWKKIKTLDLLLICVPIDSDSGRYLPLKLHPVFDTVESIYGDDVFEEKAVIVLTKANKASELIDQQAAADKAAGKVPTTLTGQVEDWKKEHKEEYEDSAVGNLPIFTVGRIQIDEKTGKPCSIDEVTGFAEWLDVLWCDTCKFSTPELTAFLYVLRKKMLDDKEVCLTVKEAIKRWITSNKVKTALAFLGAVVFAVGAAPLLPAVAAAGFVVAGASAIAGVVGYVTANVDVPKWKERFNKKKDK